MNHNYPLVTVAYAPDALGKMKPVNAVVTLRTAGPSICLRPDGSEATYSLNTGPVSDEDRSLAMKALVNALGGRK